MTLAAGARDGLRLERHDGKVVGQAPSTKFGIETRGQVRVLRADAGGAAPLMPIVVSSRRGAELLIFLLERRVVVAERGQCRAADRHRVGAERKGLGHVGAV